ncbi:alpha-amylase family glycosyl hydrolase [Sanyastnella coralliicola]|uniref:alpha-amylase family glycosyl hydrolase n=1 Tax=Sanyastnella coralliicola TaxID=3069118 RepID=UPI0027B9799C|nr:alpha-amylase family glycosyl hydrolase [Longitalea sp. SCSIO 12813]
MKNLYIALLAMLLGVNAQSQVVWTEPAFPTQTDQVTLYYDASEGNGDVEGVIPVYAHTGVITNESTGPNDWQYVVGNWGTADSETVMQFQGNNIHTFDFGGQTLEDFYNLPDGIIIEELAFVFRNASGTLVGREADGGDIFFPITDGGFAGSFATPVATSMAIEEDDSIDFEAICSEAADLSITVDGSEVASSNDATELAWTFSGYDAGEYLVEMSADNGMESVTDQVIVVVLPSSPTTAFPPASAELGINYINDTSVLLYLYAPYKDNVFVVGDFNNWEFGLDYLMTKTPDNSAYWIEITGLTPGQEYRFHYHVMPDNMRIADPYSEKILDYWNDPWIEDEVYPNLIEFPAEFTTNDPVGILQTAQEEYNWTDGDYERPEKESLVIYELLVRDFIQDHSMATLLDTLDYIERLGANAIEFMPFNEFEGNNSWGYNPMFFFAPDKYYGTETMYKDFVNECHERGIAIILDIALNHSFGQNPQVRMWFDPSAGEYGQPTSQNPYFNEVPMHDFNVGYDYNHESGVTREFCKRVLEHWITEYHIDGYRMDLSKGFTQNNTLGNVGAWNQYDQSRVDILNDYAGHVWSVDSDAYMILEHFANNDEETALANQGFMLWGNHNHDFNEASMGYSSNFNWASYQQRGWNDPHLIAFAESHDEERLMYKNLLYGNSNGGYDITNMSTALARQEMVHVFLMSIPGPKMMWQFGELGYDYSINTCEDGVTIEEGCRTSPKPIRWDYQDEDDRARVYNVSAAMNLLHTTEAAFSTNNFSLDVGGTGKRIHLNHPEMNVVVAGNFDVVGFDMSPGFQNTGTWYDYFSGESFEVTDVNVSFFFEPGEYHVYTDQPLETPVIDNSIEELEQLSFNAWPNPFRDVINIDLSNFAGQNVTVQLTDITGRTIDTIYAGNASNRSNLSFPITDELGSGMYVIVVDNGSAKYSVPVLRQ